MPETPYIAAHLSEDPEGVAPEGDYRPASARVLFHQHAAEPNIRVEPLQIDFLQRLADALNTTLELNALLHRVADLVRAVIDYRIFAILLINDRTQELYMRFQTGHTAEVERLRIRLGRGISGQAALERRSLLVPDVRAVANYIDANPDVRSELAVPLIVKNKVIGVLDLQSEALGFFTADHQRLLELTASRVAIAIDNARLYTRVSRQAQALTVLQDISREITSILDMDDLLERIGTLLRRVVDFQMFTILLWNGRTGRLEHRFSTRYGERVVRERNVMMGHGIIGSAAASRMPILASDVRKDPRYVAENPETRSELSVPLIYKGGVIGVIDLEHTRVHYFTEEHQRTLTTLAAQVAISIVNARLYQRIHEEEQRLERDLEMAREVQISLMPPAPPRLQHAELAASFAAARSIGGDIYDFLDYGPPPNPDLEDPEEAPVGGRLRRTLIALGDVSGKAAPAALYSALVSGVLRSVASRRLPPAALLRVLNAQLQERRLLNQYVTMLAALWDDETRTLRLSNAGSVQPLLVRRLPTMTSEIEVRTLRLEGFPLGLFPDAEYDEAVLELDPGDLLLFFSDGITDATNSQGEQFGAERLSLLLQHHPTAAQSASEAVAAVVEAIRTHQAGLEHSDDETLVALKVM